MTAVKAQANALMSKAMTKGDVNTRQQLTHDGWGGRGKVGAGHLQGKCRTFSSPQCCHQLCCRLRTYDQKEGQ